MPLPSSIRRSAALLLLPLLVASCHSKRHTPFREAKLLHKHGTLSPSQIYTLSKLTDIQHMNEVLDNICIPRVVGSSGHRKVRQYITSNLRNLGWIVESDEFDDFTPTFGTLRFENIIAKWNPNAKRYLTLACHYDSKYVKDYDFIGATDSAVPCMQLLNLAKVMERQLNTIKDNDVSLMLLFFDGEEAFHRWGPKDSIYGARHLAAKWERNKYTYGAENDITDIDKIDMLVLLDLIGASNPTFYNFFRETSKWFSLMSSAETALANLSQLNNYSHKPGKKYFQDYLYQSHIEDDHLPFLKRNVPILHLIPQPFPDVWHTAGDNRSVVHLPTVENLNKILRVFVASYLNMQVKEDEEESVQSMEHMEL